MAFISSPKKIRETLFKATPCPSEKLTRPLPVNSEITDWDQDAFREITSTLLNAEQMERIISPAQVFPNLDTVVALHWHAEFVPMELIRRRINSTFPNKKRELIIPTDHNLLRTYDGEYSGVEVDCYSPEFNRKVQLLIHFKNEKLEHAAAFRAMLDHTHNYRSSQLFELFDSILDPRWDFRLRDAARATGADEDLMTFVQIIAKKLRTLLFENMDRLPRDQVKNRLLANYCDQLREFYDDRIINRAQYLIQMVKRVVKRNFNHQYFYETREIIEEARALGGGIVIAHPEQFWPVLLADYDVDGYEVWNPQSQEYTEFLINVVARQNKSRSREQRPLLIFLGDDTHMGEKSKPPEHQNKEKSARQIGVQTAWDDIAITKSLCAANMDRNKLIDEYSSRLG